MREEIRRHLAAFDLDVRKSCDARFVDQKCTPDLVSFIADCVMALTEKKQGFTVKDLWRSEYFIKNVRVMFNKPYGNNKKAANEYNKVLSQPLKLLAYARVLHVEKVGKRGTLHFSEENAWLLEYIAKNMFNAYEFLYCYFEKVMTDSGLAHHFEEYKRKSTANPANAEQARVAIYSEYLAFIRKHTPSKSKLDIPRMFHKVFNIYAAEYELPGSSGETAYKNAITYNRVNKRDVCKWKNETREEAVARIKRENREARETYNDSHAADTLRKIRQDVSEIQDDLALGAATNAHHIFPKARFRKIAGYPENLILLTAAQHYTKAHPGNNTRIIDPAYQLVCLLNKSRSIEESIAQDGEYYYSKQRFLEVVKLGAGIELDISMTFDEIRDRLRRDWPESE